MIRYDMRNEIYLATEEKQTHKPIFLSKLYWILVFPFVYHFPSFLARLRLLVVFHFHLSFTWGTTLATFPICYAVRGRRW